MLVYANVLQQRAKAVSFHFIPWQLRRRCVMSLVGAVRARGHKPHSPGSAPDGGCTGFVETELWRSETTPTRSGEHMPAHGGGEGECDHEDVPNHGLACSFVLGYWVHDLLWCQPGLSGC